MALEIDKEQNYVSDVSDIHHHTDMDELITCDEEHMDDRHLTIWDDRLDDINEPVVSEECYMKTCWHYKHCAAYTLILLGIIMVMATTASLVITVLVVVPYIQVSNFAESICEVKTVSTNIGNYTCSCGKDCHSKYPCISIHVYVTGTHVDGYNASLHNNEVTLGKEVIINCI